MVAPTLFSMMSHALRVMMYLLRKYDVAHFIHNDAMFALMCPQAHIIRRSRHHWASPYIICRRQTSFKKPYLSMDK